MPRKRDHVELTTRRGDAFLVDADDAQWVSRLRWTTTVTRHDVKLPTRIVDGVRRSLPREIMEAKRNEVVRARNGDLMDCRKSNLFIIPRSQIQQGRRVKKKPGSSQYVGVVRSYGGKYRAVVCKDGNQLYSETCASELDAALAYDRMARELYGPNARVNFPNGRRGQ